ncbi:MAG TPA: GH92 family glycosyl hydrolase [Sediminibacterium sp.]|nr:GH92 family glycosyl hydrolase [Sediminibacterium sp.]
MLPTRYMLLVFFLCLQAAGTGQKKVFEPEEWVNPLMGTDSKYSFSSGNTYPDIRLPWGMNGWTAQTNPVNANGWQYQYTADKIYGIKQTHQPSPWIGDYGQFSVLPMTGHLKYSLESRGSWFSHKAETAKPYYYSVYLADYAVRAEIVPTQRAAILRCTYPQADSASLLVDAFDKGSYIRVIPETNTIVGYTTRNRGGVPKNFRNYFIIRCSKPFQWYTLLNDTIPLPGEKAITCNHAQIVVGFATNRGEVVEWRMASSFISPEQAAENLQAELQDKDFAHIQAAGKKAWHEALSRVEVTGNDPEQIRTFYSCLYRMLLFPRSLYEQAKDGTLLHYSPYNGKLETGYLYTDTGFWDTFRALFPFLTLLYADVDQHIMEGLVNTVREGGWLPEWASPGYRNSMIGSNSAAVIADAYLKGIRGYDIETLYQAIQKNTSAVGPVNAVGRIGWEWYNRLGFIPSDAGISGSVARSLEYAYDDYCLAEIGQALRKPAAETEIYWQRAGNYRRLFDNSHLLMHARLSDGRFDPDFKPLRWGREFVEGNAWHYTWSVFHDIAGLKKLMGGDQRLESMLDSVFNQPPLFDSSGYGKVIHEMREMQVMDMGQYAHGNQPIQHMLYLYDYCGTPWKTQRHVREAMQQLYRATPDGYCGDEDNGQTSAWYVFSALGFYPVCPGSGQYVIGSPLFRQIRLHLDNGKTFLIEAPGNENGRSYIGDCWLNGSRYTRNYLLHATIRKGGNLRFQMQEQPVKTRGITPADQPFSMSDKNP